MSKKSFALFTLEYPPIIGGVSGYLRGLVNASSGNIDVIVPLDHPHSKDEYIIRENLFRTKWPNWLPSISACRRAKKKYQYVLVSHVLPLGTAAWIARLLGGPKYLVICHGLDIRRAEVCRRKRFLLRCILRCATKVIANSDFTASQISRIDKRVRPLVLRPALDKREFPDRVLSRAKMKVRNDEFIILSVARLVRRKGIDRIIEILPRLPENVRLVIIGDGDDRLRLEALGSRYGDRVLFLNEIKDEERDAWYSAADLFALVPREEGDDVEGFGMVFLEAAAAGLPVVAGASGGVGEAVLDGKTGFCVPPDDRNALERVVKEFIFDQQKRNEFGQAGKTRVDLEFGWRNRWEELSSAVKLV